MCIKHYNLFLTDSTLVEKIIEQYKTIQAKIAEKKRRNR